MLSSLNNYYSYQSFLRIQIRRDSLNVTFPMRISVRSLLQFNPLRFFHINTKPTLCFLKHLVTHSCDFKIKWTVDHCPSVSLHLNRLSVFYPTLNICIEINSIVSVVQNLSWIQLLCFHLSHILLHSQTPFFKHLIHNKSAQQF